MKNLDELQKEKIQLEINEINKAWYKRKDYLQIALPAILALFSLIYAIVSGFFSSKYEQYQLQKEQLQLEVLYFEQKKENLLKNNEILSVANTKLKATLDEKTQGILILKGQLSSKQQDILKKEQDLALLLNETSYYDEAIMKLQSEYDTKKQSFQGEVEKQLISEAELTRKMEEKNNVINRLQDDNLALKHQIQLSLDNPFIPKSRKYEYQEWTNNEMLKYYNNILKKNEDNLRLLERETETAKKKSDSAEAKYKSLKIIN